MSISIQSAVKGGPEMAFWPAVVSGFLYAESGSTTYIILLTLLGFSGALMYITLRRAFAAYEQVKENIQTRTRQRRNNQATKLSDALRELGRITKEILPDRKIKYWIVAPAVLLNSLAGAVLWLMLANRVVIGQELNIGIIGLFSLPVFYGFVVVSVLLWNV